MSHPVKVSVVVPVYNPGANIDDCIRSLTHQSLRTRDHEVIFVDDGSTDDTPARLDALARRHRQVRVEHIENSGWPGRPRNVGLDLARGEYVLFVDNDDWLGAEALERLHATAARDEADVVIGKVVGQGRDIPRAPFVADRRGVTLEWEPLLDLLTPHKLFRTAFLREHGIRFPDEPRRLEDHLFVVHAFLHARSISVLAGYPCYRWVLREDATNASYGRYDVAAYFRSVREVLDLVAEHTEPGPLRDRLCAHWYRGKMLGRVGGAYFLRRSPRRRRTFYRAIRALALERYEPDVERFLPFNLRLRSRLLRDGRYGLLELLAGAESRLGARASLRSLRTVDGGLELRVRGALTGPRTAFLRRDGRLLWNAPARLRAYDLDATGDLERARVEIVLRSADGIEYVVPGPTEPRLVPVRGREDAVRATPTATVRIDPATAAAGAPLPPGDWAVRAVVTVAGFTGGTPVHRRDEEGPLVLTVTRRGRISDAPPPTLAQRVSARLGRTPAR